MVRETKITVEQVIRQLSKIAFSNGVGAVISVKDGQFFIREDADLENVILLSQKNYETKKKISKSFALKTEDRILALHLLSEILGFYRPRTEPRTATRDFKAAADRILGILGRRKTSSSDNS